MIEIAQMRKMSDRELEDALKQAKQDLWSAHFALSTRQLSDTSTIPQHRRTIARILTVRRERETASGDGKNAGSTADRKREPAASEPKRKTRS